MTACTHGMPTPASCLDCMEDGPVAAPTPPARWERPPYSVPIDARYPGWCAGCAQPIVVGEPIASWRNGDEIAWVHEDCEP